MTSQGKNKLIDKCDALYVWHKDAIYRMAFDAVGNDKEWALNLLGECMMEACANVEKFDVENSDESKSKITAILHSRINKIYHEAWQKMDADNGTKNVNVTQKEKFDVDQILTRNESKSELAKYVESLSNEDRELIFMRYFMGFTPEDLSKQCQSSPEEIEKRIFLVKQKISKMIMGR